MIVGQRKEFLFDLSVLPPSSADTKPQQRDRRHQFTSSVHGCFRDRSVPVRVRQVLSPVLKVLNDAHCSETDPVQLAGNRRPFADLRQTRPAQAQQPVYKWVEGIMTTCRLLSGLVLLFLVLGARPALAQRYTVEEIVVEADVQPDGSMAVRERLT